MKKPVLITVIVIAVLLVFAYFFLWGSSLKTILGLGPKNGSKIGRKNDSVADTLKGKLDDLISLGKSVECVYKENNDGTKTTVTAYISGKNFRLDSVVINEDAEEMNYHQISDGEWVYIWGSGMGWGEDETKGFKMSMDASQLSGNKNSYADSYKGALSMLKAFDYDCKAWIANPSKFKAPSDIEFVDMNKMLEGLKEQTENLTKELCEKCNELTEAEQVSACRDSLKCDE